MAPQKFASVRYKTRPVARIAPFRDDTSLVALRYEQTKQAEPPIPLPPRNPRRGSTRPVSTLTSSTGSSPIVITPPPFPPPPQEEHPFFRTQSVSGSTNDEWKRDSGLAPTASSVTIHEEYDEETEFCKLVDEPEIEAPSLFSDEQSVREASPTPRGSASPPSIPLRLFTMPLRPPTPDTPIESPVGSRSELPSPVSDAPTSPSRATSFTKKLGKTFSMRTGQTKRLRKKSLSDDGAPSLEGTPARGSLKNPKTSPPRHQSSEPEDKGERVSISSSLSPECNFTPITTHIPADSLFDDFSTLSFSKRGSVMFGGKRALNRNAPSPLNLSLMTMEVAEIDEKAAGVPTPSPTTGISTVPAPALAPVPALPTPPMTASEKHLGDAVDRNTTSKVAEPTTPNEPMPPASPTPPSIRVLSADVERDSQKVRSLYEFGEGVNWQDGAPGLSLGERLEPTEEVPSDEEENVVSSSDRPSNDQLTPMPASNTPRSASSLSLQRDSQRGEHELAGGFEDWEDVEGADVDRYGFIRQTRPASSAESPEKPSQFSPRRRRNMLTSRPDSSYSSSPHPPMRGVGRKISTRSLNTHTSEFSTASRRSTRSSIRSAANHLPHNRDRRWMDEAGDMLTMHPGLTDIAEDQDSSRIAESLKHKEWERSEKWRKMAKVVKNGAEGAASEFEFDTKNPKLIERTWKGIPDCWRGAAWHSFLAASAKAWKSQETHEQLVAEFHRLQDIGSPDDVQIDLDVPRTINRHIMFRRRYRGGQRLLFRVLHAISLYYPETGYVQGMASLAATLLCYYDEERCFVMMVRMWKYRGLERLYQPGFAGLMDTLKDFEKNWLGDKDVASKLSELAIDPTAYGTRWYLTLFNLSIPFPAQLRVWDVFMLLGDCPPEPSLSVPSPPEASEGKTSTPPPSPHHGIDILHATSAALIHALRDVLLDSDFENAMKALTSWVPVKDEELLMKVTRAEWKQHQGTGNGKKSRA
ncbi:RabGAP/TBC [Thozetella sp. PMI_491]|nr:RabGAP/TBC [Thozetella sp. PMI_491]